MSNIGEKSLFHRLKTNIIPIHYNEKLNNQLKFKTKKSDSEKSYKKSYRNYFKKKSTKKFYKNKIIEKTIKFLKKKYFLLNDKNENSNYFKMNFQNLSLNNKNNNFNTINSNNSMNTNITTFREDEKDDFEKKTNILKLNLLNFDSKENSKKKDKNKNITKNLSLKFSNNKENNKKNLIIFNSINKILNNSPIKNSENSPVLSSIKLKNKINYSDKPHKLIKITKQNKIFGFKSTTKLNHYLICDYKTEESSNISLSKQKLKLSEKTFNNIKKERNEIIYKKSLNYYAEDEDRIKFYYKLYHNKTETDENKNYTEREVKNALNKYYFNKTLNNLKKRNKFLRKIADIGETYEKLNKSNKETINYNNLKRIITLKKVEKNCMGNNIEYKKKKFQKEHDEILLHTSKMIPSCLTKNEGKLKLNTISQFKMVSGLYFGVPS